MKEPYEVYRIEDFTRAQIDRAAAEPEKYSAALVFSTKYDPPSLPLSLGPKSEALDERYFGLHHDLAAGGDCATKLGGNAGVGGRGSGHVDCADPV